MAAKKNSSNPQRKMIKFDEWIQIVTKGENYNLHELPKPKYKKLYRKITPTL